MLLLWLSIVCMIPFDMARFDGLREEATGTVERRRPVVERILETAKVKECELFTVVKPCGYLVYTVQKLRAMWTQENGDGHVKQLDASKKSAMNKPILMSCFCHVKVN